MLIIQFFKSPFRELIKKCAFSWRSWIQIALWLLQTNDCKSCNAFVQRIKRIVCWNDFFFLLFVLYYRNCYFGLMLPRPLPIKLFFIHLQLFGFCVNLEAAIVCCCSRCTYYHYMLFNYVQQLGYWKIEVPGHFNRIVLLASFET